MRISWQQAARIIAAALLILLLPVAIFLVTRKAVGNYSDPRGPLFEGSYAEEIGKFDGSLRVVTWNLHYAEKMEEIIDTLENIPELRDADILLFQEIDAEGASSIARRLHYNYVLYPASFNRKRQKEVGNAIFAKVPLSDPAKIVLPNFLPGWLESRISTRATISLGDREIHVYSTHFDITWMIFTRGESQGDFLAGEAGEEDKFIIMGGDFNTWNPASIALLTKQLSNAGLQRLTTGAGYTFDWKGLKFTLDHIFSKPVNDYQAGVYRQTKASDHYPVWVTMTLDDLD